MATFIYFVRMAITAGMNSSSSRRSNLQSPFCASRVPAPWASPLRLPSWWGPESGRRTEFWSKEENHWRFHKRFESFKYIQFNIQSYIIIIYFENVTFFHPKLGSHVCSRVDNVDIQTSGNALQYLIQPLVEKSPSASYPHMAIGARFLWRDALLRTNHLFITLSLNIEVSKRVIQLFNHSCIVIEFQIVKVTKYLFHQIEVKDLWMIWWNDIAKNMENEFRIDFILFINFVCRWIALSLTRLGR